MKDEILRELSGQGGEFFMAWQILVFIFCVLGTGGVAQADPGVFMKAEVQSIDVYPGGANFTFRVEAGERFSFTLPGAFDRERVRCLTRENLTSLRVDSAYAKTTQPEEFLKLRRDVDAKSRVVSRLEGRKGALSQAQEMLRLPFSVIYAPGGGQGRQDKGDRESLIEIDYIAKAREYRLEIETELVEVNEELQKAEEELRLAQEEFDVLSRTLEERKPLNASTVLEVSGTTAVPSTLLFEAWTSVAGWNVEYEMDMDSATGDVDVKMDAVVRQRTGLDVDADLAFHTRRPSSVVEPPEVRPLVVDIASKTPRADLMMSYYGASASRSKSEAYAPAPPNAQEFAPDAIATLADVTIRGRGRIGGDGQPARIMLGGFGLKSVPVLVVIPEQNREAWIVASMDSIPPSFLPGVAGLAVDGAQTGRAAISEAVAGRMQVPFGMSARLTSKKERFVEKTGSTWTGTGLLENGYTLEITSALEAEREITVRDRIPVPASDKIVLEVKKIDPAPVERDKENRLLWKLKIEPGETKKITVEYTLRYPGEETLSYH
ncbi:MAG: DUF4139 domain-containing protein [Synergistaceae bacterium]|jgi:uncharacterized protein (TIGR02231 family)|nr:DUF4139 domain-containing protein [Synergistaceae bacterium]